MVRAILLLLTILLCDVKCERQNCQLIPVETDNGQRGYCCIFKNSGPNESGEFSNERKIYHKQRVNVPVQPADDGSEEGEFNWDDYKSFRPVMDNRTDGIETTDIVFPNLERHDQGTAITTAKTTKVPSLDDRFNVNAPVTCTQGYRKTARGCVKEF